MSKITISSLPIDERIALAGAKTQKLVDGVINLLPVHEANQIIVYTPRLASQIPRSYAAHAFNSFSDSMLRFEIVRICALFDPCRDDDLEKESIPAVVKLIDHNAVLDALAAKARSNYISPSSDAPSDSVTNGNEGPQTAFGRSYFLRRGEEEAVRTFGLLKLAIDKTKALENNGKLKAVRNFRDKFVAHSLRETKLEKRETVKNMRYGDEKVFLWKAIAIVDALHCGINGTGFAWQSSINMSRRNAALLWNNCTFQIGGDGG